MRGEVVYLYAFDVANEIATEKVKDILANKPFPFEIRTHHTFPKDVPLYKPLAIEPPALPASLGGRAVRLLIRVYSVGVVSIAMRVPFENEKLADLVPLHKPVLENGVTLDQVARDLCADVCKSLADVLIERSLPSEPEAYTVFCLTEAGSERDVNGWLAENRRAVAELLTETAAGGLSEMQTAEVLRIQRSYGNADLVVIDWDAALVVDLSGYVDDVLYVLELANLQLEEYRVMDQRLDRYLDRAYEDLKRGRFGMLGTYSKTLSTLRLFRVDVTKLNDEVTHISKFFGDWYLARVFLGASERFYLSQWRQSVADRLGQLDQLYSVVNSDINNRRMVWLEVLVVIFFAIDLAMLAFWRR
ncbi:MAG TPA: hypothetical protein VGZ26_08345 [Pirellulales bacterium]|jgi:hypothetical protein|nr:hypothetical protein [Pirellulales bacterium]